MLFATLLQVMISVTRTLGVRMMDLAVYYVLNKILSTRRCNNHVNLWNNSMIGVLIVGIGLIAYSGMPMSAQSSQSEPVGSVTGVVINSATQAPIPGATLQVSGTKLGGVSRNDGKFSIKKIPVGIVSIKVTAIGYEPFILTNVAVSSGKPFMVTIQLTEQEIKTTEVVVTAGYFQKNNETTVSTQTLGSEEVRRAPGVQEDVVRYVQILPGVAATAAGRNDLIVRGGAPFENLFIVDNLEVPNINHFGSQGSTGGPLSIINIDFVRDVTFSAGGFGTRFGDRVSSLTNINLREGNSEQFTGEVVLSATAFGAIVEGPIGDKANFFFSARRSYLDLLFAAIGVPIVPEYWDFQFKATYDINEKNKVSFLGIGALNDLKLIPKNDEQRVQISRIQVPTQPQYFSGITWKSLFENGFVQTTLGRTFTRFNTRQSDSLGNQLFSNQSREGENSLRSELFYYFGGGKELNVGFVAKYASQLRYNLLVDGRFRRDENGNERSYAIDTSFTAFRNGIFANYTTMLGESFRTTLGVRGDYYSFTKDALFLSPRGVLSYLLSPTQTINLSVGRYYQAPQFIWLVGDASNKAVLNPIRADQAVLGFEWQILDDTKIQLETYYKSYNGYPSRVWRRQAVLAPSGFDDLQNDIPFGLEPITNQGTGTVRGVELFIQKKLSETPFFGILSVSYNQSRFTGIDGVERRGTFDAPLVVNIAGGYRIGTDWEISARFRFSTGLPTTNYFSNRGRDSADRTVSDPSYVVDRSDPRFGTINFATLNEAGRLPDLHSLDVRVDKRWSFTGFQLITYIDIQNIYNRKNATRVTFDQRKGYEVTDLPGLGLLPSIGLNFEF